MSDGKFLKDLNFSSSLHYLPLLPSFNYEIINTTLASHMTDFQFKIHLCAPHLHSLILGGTSNGKNAFNTFEL